ncbi:hypothetical protein Nepgr_025894 [Nepenthes gracilis]|uniref:Uncharacterized protein n=1 Tax=Nepenthes gracilis TaxID=150966 RepID=A0AAD3T8P9_NEPGR|nr:hypothetical protein Nepgr_025894 [Nepenthes gracilis]
MGEGEANPDADFSNSTSGEDDGDENWKAGINSIATGLLGGSGNSTGFAFTSDTPVKRFGTDWIPEDLEDDDCDKPQPQAFKHYQIKAQNALDNILKKTLVMVKDPICAEDNEHDPGSGGGGIRLFKGAPPGIVFDHIDKLHKPRKKPRILPGEEINEKSKEFKRQVESVAVNSKDILAAAKDACRKSLAKMTAKEAAAKEAAGREEERVAKLRGIRGERWLPSLVREMNMKFQFC